MNYIFLLLLILAFPLKAMSQLAMPIDPAGQNKDWWVWTYVNDNPDTSSSSIAYNFKCSPYAYKWSGTIFALKNMQLMDEGVPVLAAGPGVVVNRYSTYDDRTKRSDSGGHGNYIIIQHNPNLFTFYGFLRKNSARFKIGQTVKKGDTISFVGSSGEAYSAKLYFRIEDSTGTIFHDPFGCQCCTPSYTALLTPSPIYDTTFGLIDAGVMNSSGVTLDTIIERPPTVTEISVTDDAYVCVWTQVKNSYTGDYNEHIWIKPDGSIFHRAQWTETNDSHIGYPRSWQPTYNLDTGIWIVKCLFNGDSITTQTFHVVEQHSGVAQTTPIIQAIAFPQPSKNHTTIDGITAKEARLYDIEGIEHPIRFEQNTDGTTFTWQDLPKGIYFLSIRELNGLLHRAKIMVSP